MINNVILTGWLHSKDELKTSRDGTTPYIRFLLSVPTGKANDGSRQYCFVRVTCFRTTAETIARLPDDTDSVIMVQGRLHQSRWTNKEGERRSSIEVVGERVIVAGKRQAAAEARDRKADWSADDRETKAEAAFDDDIPF